MTEIVLGPPGTGKTTTLMKIVADELAAGVPPDRIGYVSFTTRAAGEAVGRLSRDLGLDAKDFPYFRTLHSLCYRQLGLSKGDVLEGKKLQGDFAGYAGVKITGRFSEDGLMSGFDMGDRIVFMENLARVRCIPLRQQYDLEDDGLPWAVVDRVSRSLTAFKQEHGLMDFTDMLSEFVKSGIRVVLDLLVVDEAQDLSLLQWMVVEALAKHAKRVCVAGDDDQAIYRWSGADSDHLINMEGSAQVLGQSYRVPPAVQVVANRLVPFMGNRRDKQWAAKQGTEGVVDRANQFGDLDYRTGEVLVLARNTYILRDQVEPVLRRQGVIWDHSGRSSISRAAIQAITTWEQLRRGLPGAPLGDVRQMYEQISSGPTGIRRGFKLLEGVFDEDERRWDEEQDRLPRTSDPEEREARQFRVTLEQLRDRGGLEAEGDQWYEVLNRLPAGEVEYIRSALETARSSGERATFANLTRPRVRISTIHGSKGGEADHVVVMKEIAARTFQEMQWAPEDEARVWYVAATRARERLTIVDSTTPRACPWL